MTPQMSNLIAAVTERKYSLCIDCNLKIDSLNEARVHAEDFDHAVLDYMGAKPVN